MTQSRLSVTSRPGLCRHALAAGCLLGLLAALTVGAAAADINCVWIGTDYGDWSDPANWEGGIIPINSASDKYHVSIALPDPSAFSQSALTQAMTVSRS